MPLKNKEERKLYCHLYNIRNGEKIRARAKIYRTNNKEKIKLINRRYYLENKTAHYAQQKIYKKTNADKVAEFQKLYRLKNRDIIRIKRKICDNTPKRKMHRFLYSQRIIKEMEDPYIRAVLTNNNSMRAKEIPQAMVECKKQHLKLKRFLNELK